MTDESAFAALAKVAKDAVAEVGTGASVESNPAA